MKIRQLESYSTGNPQSYPQLLGITLGQLNINDLQQSAKLKVALKLQNPPNYHFVLRDSLLITDAIAYRPALKPTQNQSTNP